jgi:hypothetical protein
MKNPILCAKISFCAPNAEQFSCSSKKGFTFLEHYFASTENKKDIFAGHEGT